jgi:hypothetical protein
LHETIKAKGTPDWLASETGMGLIEELDVQIGSQKDPVFLLNRPAPQRARALAVGTDSGYVQTMMNLSKEELSEAKALIKSGERQLEVLHRQIQTRLKVRSLDLAPLSAETEHLRERASATVRMANLVLQWETAGQTADALSTISGLSLPELPTVSPTGTWEVLARQWEKNSRLSEQLSALPEFDPDIPALQSGAEWPALAETWAAAEQKAIRLCTLPEFDPLIPALQSGAEWPALAETWAAAEQKATQLCTLPEFDPAIPALQSSAEWPVLAETWAVAEKKAAGLRDLPVSDVSIPTLSGRSDHEALLARWQMAEAACQARSRLGDLSFDPDIPVFHDTHGNRELLARWTAQSTLLETLAREIAADEAAVETALADLSAIEPETCPTCQQPWPHAHGTSQP